jgi:putative acetyltransferase
LFDIWHSAVLHTHHFLSADDREHFALLVHDQYLPSVPLTVAVDEHDRPLAFMGMTGCKIDALFVAPERHGEGIGRALVDEAARICATLEVDVNEQNEAALRFYERLGFRRIGRSALDPSGRPYPILHLERSA